MKPAWQKAAEYAGLDLSPDQVELMGRYGSWLATEGSRAGGIGPAETGRIDRRHLADSLLFGSLVPGTATELWDLGSGIGLPGIPLAIALPDISFRLVDRSGKRTDLMRRAVRLLGIENCQVIQGQIAEIDEGIDVIVSRASLPPGEMIGVVHRHLAPAGVAILAGSWQERPNHRGWQTVEIPEYVLDQPVWLLMMRRE